MTDLAAQPNPSRRPWLIAAGLGVIVLVIGAVAVRQQLRQPAGPPLPVLYGVTDFQLTNQLGAPFTVADLRGQVSVVNVIFTRCPVTCQVMSRQFAKLQGQLPGERAALPLIVGLIFGFLLLGGAFAWNRQQAAKGRAQDVSRVLMGVALLITFACVASLSARPQNQSVALVTLTIDPEFDTPEVLTRYGEKLGADFKRWSFVTGALAELRRVAIDDFKFVAVEKDAASQESKDDLFIHSTYFMIVDQRARVRAVIESAEPDGSQRTLEAVNRLLAEQ